LPTFIFNGLVEVVDGLAEVLSHHERTHQPPPSPQWCNADGKIVRYYRPHLKVVASPITPEKTGYEPHLYSLDGLPSDQRQQIEKHYMAPVVDDPASRALQILMARNTSNTSARLRTDWVRFLMSLSL
jgi:hypothetical protein